MVTYKYNWTDNPTQSGVQKCDTNILNDCLMHLKYDNLGGGNNLPLFSTMIFDRILIGDEAQGWALQGSLVTMTYPDAVDNVKTAYEEGVETTYRNIPCKQTVDGRYIADIAQATAIDQLYETTGIADFYILDAINNQFYLPKTKWFHQLCVDTEDVNKFNEAGLPNITGTSEAQGYENNQVSGALFTTRSPNQQRYAGGQDPRNTEIINIDASRSSSVYGKSTTVQPNSSNKLLYYKVGDVVVNSDQALIDAQQMIADAYEEVDDMVTEGLSSISNASNALRQTQVTNCILEVPNNIKIEIQSDGNLVLKAGSTVIIPDGFDEDGARKFLHKTIEQDVVTTNLAEYTTSYAFLPILNTDLNGVNWIGGINAENAFAGDTAPTLTSPNAYWYDTANNIIKFSSDTGASWSASQFSFPFCHVDITYNTSGNYYNYPKAIFNHCGFIGSVFWADEGIKYLVPNGRNDDGTLNNITLTTPEVYIHDITGENDGLADSAKPFLLSNGMGWWNDKSIYTKWQKPYANSYIRYFDDYENSWKDTSGTTTYTTIQGCTFADFYQTESCQILWFKPYSPLSLSRGANDLKIVDSYSNGTSWYRVWSDGWIEQGGRYSSVGGNGQVYITFIKNFNTTNYYINAMQLSTGTDSGTGTWSVHTISVSGFYVRNFTDATSDIGWYACGY